MADTNIRTPAGIPPSCRPHHEKENGIVEEMIKEIFISLAKEAMDRGYEIKIENDNSDIDGKTIISSNKRQTSTLTMNLWLPTQSEEYESGYEDGYDEGCMDLIDEELGDD